MNLIDLGLLPYNAYIYGPEVKLCGTFKNNIELKCLSSKVMKIKPAETCGEMT